MRPRYRGRENGSVLERGARAACEAQEGERIAIRNKIRQGANGRILQPSLNDGFADVAQLAGAPDLGFRFIVPSRYFRLLSDTTLAS